MICAVSLYDREYFKYRQGGYNSVIARFVALAIGIYRYNSLAIQSFYLS
jgi:hypothetical protein